MSVNGKFGGPDPPALTQILAGFQIVILGFLLGHETLLPDQGQGMAGHVIGQEKTHSPQPFTTGVPKGLNQEDLGFPDAQQVERPDFGLQDQGGAVGDSTERRCRLFRDAVARFYLGAETR
jgi:hypothetical protein